MGHLAPPGYLERPDSRSSIGSSQVTKTGSLLGRNFSVAGQWNEIDRQFQELNGKFDEQLQREKALDFRWVRLGSAGFVGLMGWVPEWWAEWQHSVGAGRLNPPESRVTEQHWKL